MYIVLGDVRYASTIESEESVKNLADLAIKFKFFTIYLPRKIKILPIILLTMHLSLVITVVHVRG